MDVDKSGMRPFEKQWPTLEILLAELGPQGMMVNRDISPVFADEHNGRPSDPTMRIER